MNWPLFRNRLVNRYHEQPQVVMRIDHALGLVRDGLRELGTMGLVYHLESGPAPADSPLHAPFPRHVYHLESAPRGYEVRCQSDLELLGEGWFDTLDEAKHADGMGEQFKRGGVFPKSGLPAVIIDDDQRTRLDRERQFEESE
jgi:hypothetical protein